MPKETPIIYTESTLNWINSKTPDIVPDLIKSGKIHESESGVKYLRIIN